MSTPVDVQRLRVDLVVDRALEELAELADVDVGRREHRLGEVGARSGDVVVLRGDARLRDDRCRHCDGAEKRDNDSSAVS